MIGSVAYRADQLAILTFRVLVVFRFISSSHAVLQAPSHSHHLHMQASSDLTRRGRKRSVSVIAIQDSSTGTQLDAGIIPLPFG